MSISRVLNLAWDAYTEADFWTHVALHTAVTALALRAMWGGHTQIPVYVNPPAHRPTPPPQPKIEGVKGLAEHFLEEALEEPTAIVELIRVVGGERKIPDSLLRFGGPTAARVTIVRELLKTKRCSPEQIKQLHMAVQVVWKELDPKHAIVPEGDEKSIETAIKEIEKLQLLKPAPPPKVPPAFKCESFSELTQIYLGFEFPLDEYTAFWEYLLGAIQGTEEIKNPSRFGGRAHAGLHLAESILEIPSLELLQVAALYNALKPLAPFESKEEITLDEAKKQVRELIQKRRQPPPQVTPPPKPSLPKPENLRLVSLVKQHAEEAAEFSVREWAERIASGKIENRSTEGSWTFRLMLLKELLEDANPHQLQQYDRYVQRIKAKDDTLEVESQIVAAQSVGAKRGQLATQIGEMLQGKTVDPDYKVSPTPINFLELFNQELAKHMLQLGKAAENRDSFYDAIGQQVEKSVQELKELINTWRNEHPDNPKQSGLILAESLNIKIFVLKIHPAEIREKMGLKTLWQEFSLNAQATGKSVYIANFGTHFDPVLPISQ
ncbi:MAG: hypothetical protein AB7F31_07420 [Parachlamydiales bacterium]